MRAVGLALLAAALLAAPAQGAETKYSLANGCFDVDGGPAGPYRMKATALGQYLLYTKDGKYLTSNGTAAQAADEPSTAGEWRASEDGGNVKLDSLGLSGGPTLTVGSRATGCAQYPEIELNVSGEPLKAPFTFGEVRGLMEAHIHGMAFEFLGGSAHCGRPWHPYGAPYALVDCPDHTASDGCGAVLETALSGSTCHDPHGWPTFEGWPTHDQLTHEQTYFRWLERAWRGGLRLYVNLFVENSVLCELYPLKRNSCNEMDSIRLQARDIYEFQDYIDAQSGGPGEGFFRIVTDPFEARRVIANGKLAVVLGIEVSELFNCSHRNYVPDCNKDDIDRQLEEVYKLGVRDMELVNKFDNALAGVAGDGGPTGVVVNNGNKYETDTYWDFETCQVTEGDKEQPALPRDVLIGNGLAALLPPGSAPVYPAPPHCNTIGLTDLGEHLVRRMMQRRMIIDPDHLSQAARDELFAVTESKRYSGLISSHSWSNETDYPRIYDSGGVVAPSDNSTEGYFKDWQRLRKQRDRQYFYGIGFGADMNGFSSSAGPPGEEDQITYPFKSFDGGVTIHKQQSGDRTFDFNEDGIAHYGLFPDWVEGLRQLGGDEIVDDMANGAEAYLQMWERAEGVPAPTCRSRTARLRRKGVRKIELGLPADRFLRRAGQPQQRDGRVWRWCLKQRSIDNASVTAVLTQRGRSALIATNARAQRAGNIGVGDRARRVARRAERVAPGLWIRRAGGRVFFYGAKAGRVTFAGVAARAAAGDTKTLKRYLRLGGLR
jgi:microsomal dipeptidase-like Zn-dependent dipeptidase